MVVGKIVKLTKLQNQVIVVFATISIFVSIIIGLACTDNLSNKIGQPITMSNKTIQLSLKVVCEEAEGYCELKKVLAEQPEDTSFTISNLSILPKDFHYPTFVKIYSLRKDENLTMRSHIKIVDSPPPIFN